MTTVTGWEQAPEALRQLAAELMPRPVNYRYYDGPRGEMYCWTTEPVKGKFVCWTYRPVGPGARSNPRRWKMVDRVEFARRKIAKARALARYQKAVSRG